MSGDIHLSVGTICYVKAETPATYDLAGFDGITDYVKVGEIENFGDFGGEAEVTTFTPVETGIVKKRKGSIDYGQMPLTIGKLSGDAGQKLLKEGFDGSERNTVFSVKIVDSEEEETFFTGVVSSFVRVINGANDVAMINVNFELDNKVISTIYDTPPTP